MHKAAAYCRDKIEKNQTITAIGISDEEKEGVTIADNKRSKIIKQAYRDAVGI